MDALTAPLTWCAHVDTSPGYVRRALHTPDVPAQRAAELVAVLEDLVAEGLVGWYGISTDDPAHVEVFAAGPHLTAVQLQMNVLDGASAALAAAERHDLGVLCRSPLAMGLLGGRYGATTTLPAGDVRAAQPEWLRWFDGGVPAPEPLARLDAVRAVLTSGGRSLAQGALAWIWAHSARAVPLPGFRTPAQVQDTAGALQRGPLTEAEHAAVERALGRPAVAVARP